MRTLRLSTLGAVLLMSAPASAVTIDWTPVGNPGNVADSTGFGAVGYAYSELRSAKIRELALECIYLVSTHKRGRAKRLPEHTYQLVLEFTMRCCQV